MFLLARPALDPFNYSIVLQGGEKGYAAVMEGNMNLFDPGAPPEGYTDGKFGGRIVE
jgi:hypothetical protein